MNSGGQIEQAASELQQLMVESAVTRASLFPDLRWAERIVEKRMRGQKLSPTTLRMARDALADHGRLERVENEIRDRIAAERGATTVKSR